MAGLFSRLGGGLAEGIHEQTGTLPLVCSSRSLIVGQLDSLALHVFRLKPPNVDHHQTGHGQRWHIGSFFETVFLLIRNLFVNNGADMPRGTVVEFSGATTSVSTLRDSRILF